VRVAEDYFKRPDAVFKSFGVAELTDAMDAAGVEKAVVTVNAQDPSPDVLAFPRADPKRFALSAFVDPRQGMPALRALASLVRNEPVVLARTTPFVVGGLAPNEPCYYPLYAKCIELDLPCAVNTGLPGPPVPGRCQDPLHLDEVCYFFPELKLVMAHGADPWWDVAIRLMIKYRNLHLQTSAYAPKYFPPQLIHFMNTRGQDKILFATDFPVLPFDRCLKEAAALDLREGVLEKFLYGNAERLLFASRG
jgi:predicted TIM-barrel fold metal-dependent hydrolase